MSMRGEAGWHAVYQKAYGKDRWPGLYKALKATVSHVALVNPFLSADGKARTCEEHNLREHPSIPLVFESTSDEHAAEQSALAGALDDNDEEGLEDAKADAKGACSSAGDGASTYLQEIVESVMLPLYFLDGASVIAALALGVEPGMSVLDLCAAPGGKSVVLASMLFGASAAQPPPSAVATDGVESGAPPPQRGNFLVCNESSRTRVHRLQRVLRSFLPAEYLVPGGRVFVTNVDATANAGKAPVAIARFGFFDRVLVDAPCSSDRHLARQAKGAPHGLAHWASGVVKSNAERQYDILLCAATLVKKGGMILYCTCALAEQENDGVVNKFLKKVGKAFQVEAICSSGEEDHCEGVERLMASADKTAVGALFLPDRSSFGPMYMARLCKVG
mmetsp:Transcript_100345/g.288262  ORF Transcript_100345/g.288262 Transcript_100345/m.288262 type:complete len:391 (+) Transcript_100345:63-1235(+)|eukprot:CAMPEP_0177156420 /NCGR_PEP_ID=MMETSP0367-20130122/2716_1 /TAXON_ID=447022 ORGANISM="Scrippsiella hangoei-like, Strain SHHI-4" /NCGR_SAMPLE_ID=MMETSP0367 /ASSEMBLY_ACC=CAM_ASM_000362 /LENGTH=390 /DNA_ID=CAMNT_0018601871 /DNA_START=29 /DNA_END=1201 /DNA_ORIENTATION=+